MRHVVNALGGNLGELSANWNQEDVSLKSLDIFFWVFVLCEHSCSLCAAKHIGIITHRNPHVWCI